MTAQSTTDRDRLRFEHLICEHISPGLAPWGFSLINATPYLAEFESAEVVVTLSHGRVSYEIETLFCRKADGQQTYTLYDVLDVQLGTGHKETRFFQASTSDRVAWCLQTIARLIRRYGREALIGEQAFYRQMEETSRRRNAETTVSFTRRAADDAWQRRDYSRARSLYASIEANLTPLERKRLNYANAH